MYLETFKNVQHERKSKALSSKGEGINISVWNTLLIAGLSPMTGQTVVFDFSDRDVLMWHGDVPSAAS